MCHGQLLSQAMVKARKRHQCDACLNLIESGVSYVRTTAMVGGDFTTSKLCKKCQALLEAFYETDFDPDYCFDLRELRWAVQEQINNTGTWGKFKALWRRNLASVGTNGAWHT